MGELSLYAVLGLSVGFLWGIGCSLAILYSIYLGGYRKAVEDSLAIQKPRRFEDALKKVNAKRTRDSARQAKRTTPIP